ncbi:MAG: hypothetical protein KDA84_15305, partial [Planctomycetaceae bacterium]|nr:hypothetical protein [Planctomycetaceae bacterium]
MNQKSHAPKPAPAVRPVAVRTPAVSTAVRTLVLQRKLGNSGLRAALHSRQSLAGSSGMKVDRPDSPLEREADHAAQQVMQMPDPGTRPGEPMSLTPTNP